MLQFGALPEMVLNSDNEFCSSLLNSCAGTYLREEIQDALLVDRCDSFTELADVDSIQHPRFYFFDNGVRNALVGSSG